MNGDAVFAIESYWKRDKLTGLMVKVQKLHLAQEIRDLVSGYRGKRKGGKK